MILFTSDIDWAPDDVIIDMLSIFKKYNVKCTLFCTHDSDILRESDKNLFELGIHPNFNNFLTNNETRSPYDIVKQLLEFYPKSIGVRSHSLFCSSGLLNIFKNFNLKYESSQLIPYNWNISPYNCWTGLKRIPFNWEDDVHYSFKKKFENCNIIEHYDSSKLYILNYHPIHVFLNSFDQTIYNKAKKVFDNKTKLNLLINKKRFGVRDHLIRLLKFIDNESINPLFMKDLLK